MDARELRKIRLKNDYEKMCQMKKNSGSRVIDFEVLNPENPEHYVVTFYIKTIVGVDALGNPVYRDKSVVDITFPSTYPESYPTAVMRDKPPFHVNWYRDGRWCQGPWMPEEPLWSYVRRMAKTLQFDVKHTNPKSPANADAIRFWEDAKNKKYFPCDRQELPTYEKKAAKKEPEKKTRIRFVS